MCISCDPVVQLLNVHHRDTLASVSHEILQDVYRSIEETTYNLNMYYRNKLDKYIVVYSGNGVYHSSENEPHL